VSLNGQSEKFTASLVSNITYKSGANGGDTFVNNTGLTTVAYGYGGNNNFTGGSGSNFIYDFGNNNQYTAGDGTNVVWEGYGSGDTFHTDTGDSLTIYKN
jgi:hypothetical protein